MRCGRQRSSQAQRFVDTGSADSGGDHDPPDRNAEGTARIARPQQSGREQNLGVPAVGRTCGVKLRRPYGAEASEARLPLVPLDELPAEVVGGHARHNGVVTAVRVADRHAEQVKHRVVSRRKLDMSDVAVVEMVVQLPRIREAVTAAANECSYSCRIDWSRPMPAAGVVVQEVGIANQEILEKPEVGAIAADQRVVTAARIVIQGEGVAIERVALIGAAEQRITPPRVLPCIS